MADMLSTGAAWLAGQLRGSASEVVTVNWPALGIQGTLQATFAQQLLSVTDGRGHVRVERADRDFVFLVADLQALFGITWTDDTDPRGMTVTLSSGDKYEVTPMGVNVQSWRFSDPFKTLVRMHAKTVS